MTLDERQVREASAAFTGELEQVPPMVSALKVGGQRLHRLARRGEVVEREPRHVTVHSWEWLDFALPEASFRVVVSGGTYVRTLAHDLGARLGPGGALKSLRRLRSEPFGLEGAVGLHDLGSATPEEVFARAGVPLAEALRVLPLVTLDAAGAAELGFGRRPTVEPGTAPLRAGPRSVVFCGPGRRAARSGRTRARSGAARRGARLSPRGLPLGRAAGPAVTAPPRGAAVSVGVFDGVHLGHRGILQAALARATGAPCGAPGGRCAVVSFDPHPDLVLARSFRAPAPLTPLSERRERIAALGIRELEVIPFTRELAALEPEEFVARHLVGPYQLHTLVVGEGFALGRGRGGDVPRLRAIGAREGFEVVAVPLLELDGAPVSSTRIRAALEAGRVAEAARLLGRRYDLRGRVVRGEAVGRTLGYPTANLRLHEEKFVPGDGVYAARARIGGASGMVSGRDEHRRAPHLRRAGPRPRGAPARLGRRAAGPRPRGGAGGLDPPAGALREPGGAGRGDGPGRGRGAAAVLASRRRPPDAKGFGGRPCAAGVYFLKVDAGPQSIVRKIVLLGSR